MLITVKVGQYEIVFARGIFALNGISHYPEFPDRLIRIRIKRTLYHSTQIIPCMQNNQKYS